ncbi:hypothetical protein Ancab_037931 [Ancistrocladus abbreviatus]
MRERWQRLDGCCNYTMTERRTKSRKAVLGWVGIRRESLQPGLGGASNRLFQARSLAFDQALSATGEFSEHMYDLWANFHGECLLFEIPCHLCLSVVGAKMKKAYCCLFAEYDMLHEFEAASGQSKHGQDQISCFSTVSAAVKRDISSFIGCTLVSNLGTYLGSPCPMAGTHGMPTFTSFSGSGIDARLGNQTSSHWRSTPMYVMQTAVIPSSPCMDLEKLMPHFLWGVSHERRRVPLIGWDVGIVNGWDILRCWLKWSVSDGRTTHFWTDWWLDDYACLEQFARTPLPDGEWQLCIRHFVTIDNWWDWPWIAQWLLLEVHGAITNVPPPMMTQVLIPSFGVLCQVGVSPLKQHMRSSKEPVGAHGKDFGNLFESGAAYSV